jgi:ATP-binding protein involved in chromosome partitioning
MSITKEAVLERLKSISVPGLSGDVVSLGLVSDVFIADRKVFFSITVPADKAQELEPMREAAEQAVKGLPDVAGAVVALTAEKKAGQSSPAPRPAPSRPAAPAPRHGHGPAPSGQQSAKRGVPGYSRS